MHQTLSEPDQLLIEIARSVCSEEGMDFNSLDARQVRGLIYYWCSSCNRIYPLTHLVVSKRKNICEHCKDKVKMYSNSNKYGKLRRRIFNRILDMREKESEMENVGVPYSMYTYEELAGDVERSRSIIKAHERDSEFRELDATIRQNMRIIRRIMGLSGKAGRR
ncbi:hypothetical protein [Nitrososphaera viennensis]|uniref:Uncharacterized protein n=2 Tax=Nitrososphaera viennensis TaxID=1034015 RepID=A0A060HUN9_9ARCH|nr:hypothetical protein [Nitrososphaera viennensis]AIC17146.1 hypothetical protein NVIE_028710 [Nitrososphaera viennensis EN76]UVS69037.1 hypothetical protein NWT39_14165 [Nitrososphaera viennensis]